MPALSTSLGTLDDSRPTRALSFPQPCTPPQLGIFSNFNKRFSIYIIETQHRPAFSKTCYYGTTKYPYLLSYPYMDRRFITIYEFWCCTKSISRSITSHHFTGIKNCWVIASGWEQHSLLAQAGRLCFSFVYLGIL